VGGVGFFGSDGRSTLIQKTSAHQPLNLPHIIV
jgi:hypothetical protein